VIRACNVIRCGRNALSLSLLSILYILRNAPPYDLTHCQFGNISPFALKLKEIGTISGKLVTSFRGFDLTDRLNENLNAYRHLFSVGDLFLPECDHLKSILVRNSCSPETTELLHLGIIENSIIKSLNNEVIFERIILNARQKVEKEFDIESLNDKLENLYYKLLHNNGKKLDC
jgi:hypothetical protein